MFFLQQHHSNTYLFRKWEKFIAFKISSNKKQPLLFSLISSSNENVNWNGRQKGSKRIYFLYREGFLRNNLIYIYIYIKPKPLKLPQFSTSAFFIYIFYFDLGLLRFIQRQTPPLSYSFLFCSRLFLISFSNSLVTTSLLGFIKK